MKGIKDFFYCLMDSLEEKKAILLEGEITINELGEALSKMKNNKTPGLDGFPQIFSKFFGRN